MAMLSFMRGTWSFMSRMFCSRMISGSSPMEMNIPTNERNTRDSRLHIEKAPFRGLLGFRSRGRRSRVTAGGDRIVRHEIRYGIRYLLFLFLLFQTPGEEAFLFLGNLVVIGLDARTVFGHYAVDFRLNLLIFLLFLGFQLIQGLLLHAFERVQRLVALHGILDDVLDGRPDGLQGD